MRVLLLFATLLSFGRAGEVVVGAPYSAEEVMVSIPEGGSRTPGPTKLTARFYRDSQGRERTEHVMRLDGDSEIPMIVEIVDPVAGVRYRLDFEKRSALRSPWQLAMQPYLPNPEPAEPLGTKIIEGLRVEGTRRHRLIVAASHPRDPSLESWSETWYSPELQVRVLQRVKSAFYGESLVRLQNIRREEPDASLFVLPEDFEVQDPPVIPKVQPKMP